MINNIERLFLFLSTICMPFLEKCLSLVLIFWFFCYWVIRTVCIFWKLGPIGCIIGKNTFSHSGLSFHFVSGFSFCAKLISLIRFHLFIFISILFLFLYLLETDLRKHCYNLCQKLFCLCSLLRILWCHVLYLSLSHFESCMCIWVCVVWGSVLTSLIYVT